MKARFILLVLGMMIFSSCGTYNTKIRFSSVEKEKVVHPKKDLGSTDSEELQNNLVAEISESVENQEIHTYDSAVDSQEEGVDGQKVENASNSAHSLRTITEEKVAEQFEKENPEEKKIHRLAIVGFSTTILGLILAFLKFFIFIGFPSFLIILLLLIGIITSIVAFVEIKRNPIYKGYKGKGLSIAAWLSIILALITIFIYELYQL